jgi:hypothetical protein
MDKVAEGQMANSELTFRDLETIREAFVRVLAGHYHSRIEYPGQEEEETQEKPKEKEAEKKPKGVEAGLETLEAAP